LRRKKGNSSFGVLFIFVLIVAGALYVYNSAMFERELPKVELSNYEYWNLKKPLHLKIEDSSGIKSYKVILKTDNGDKTLKVAHNTKFYHHCLFLI
jgi:hypothetical protein